MSKKESTFLNMIISLFAITIIAGAALGFINDVTEGPIAKAKLDNITTNKDLVIRLFISSP